MVGQDLVVGSFVNIYSLIWHLWPGSIFEQHKRQRQTCRKREATRAQRGAQKEKKKGGGGGGGGGKEDTFGNAHAGTSTELEKTENFHLLYLISSVYCIYFYNYHTRLKITCNINNGYGTICRKACIKNCAQALYGVILVEYRLYQKKACYTLVICAFSLVILASYAGVYIVLSTKITPDRMSGVSSMLRIT